MRLISATLVASSFLWVAAADPADAELYTVDFDNNAQNQLGGADDLPIRFTGTTSVNGGAVNAVVRAVNVTGVDPGVLQAQVQASIGEPPNFPEQDVLIFDIAVSGTSAPIDRIMVGAWAIFEDPITVGYFADGLATPTGIAIRSGSGFPGAGSFDFGYGSLGAANLEATETSVRLFIAYDGIGFLSNDRVASFTLSSGIDEDFQSDIVAAPPSPLAFLVFGLFGGAWASHRTLRGAFRSRRAGRLVPHALIAVLALAAAPWAHALPDRSVPLILRDDDGLLDVCDAPCFRIVAQAEGYLDGNPSAPAVCPAGNNTYVYTLSHAGGSGTTNGGSSQGLIAPLDRFAIEVDFGSVTTAGFIPGPDTEPNSVIVSSLNVVIWGFPPPGLFPFQSSVPLYLCSSATPSVQLDNRASATGLILAADRNYRIESWHQDSSGILGVSEAGDLFGNAVASGDFDGDGYDDLAIGHPGEELNGLLEAGALNVIYGSVAGLTNAGDQSWGQDLAGILDTAEAGDLYGHALASGNFNGDGFEDLAIGVPGEDTGGKADAGAVGVLYGSGTGLTDAGDQFWNADTPGVLGVSQPGEKLGTAVATGDFDGDGFDDLAMGRPFVDLGSELDAGAVNILYGSGSGLTAAGDQSWGQDLANVLDTAEDYDFFGFALASGDFNADGYDDLAIGVPGESVGAASAAGAVNILYGAATGLNNGGGGQFWHQNSPGILGVSETGDNFGKTLATGDFNGDGFDDLAIGLPDQELAGADEAGAVQIIYGSASGLTASGDQLWGQDLLGSGELPEDGDFFGRALASGDFDLDGFDDLAIGVPLEGVEFSTPYSAVGAVHIMAGTAAGLTPKDLIQDRLGHSSRFGTALASGRFEGSGQPDGLAVGVPGAMPSGAPPPPPPASNDEGRVLVYYANGICGNSVVTHGEQCDDGNTVGGDCCSPTCQFEKGPGTPPCCSVGVCQVGSGCGSICFTPGTCKQPGGLGTACTCTAP